MYTAVIIEPREHKALPFVINNFLNGLNEDWSILILCSIQNEAFVNRLLTPRVYRKIIFKRNITKVEYSKICTSETFHHLIPTETFLLFQTDSLILNPAKLSPFLKYDYVGAPWPNRTENSVGNGGLSLRKKSKMLEIIRKVPYRGEPEDVYFCNQKIVTLERPSLEEAKEFSVEYFFHPAPFGTHQPWVCNNYPTLLQLYPDIKEIKIV